MKKAPLLVLLLALAALGLAACGGSDGDTAGGDTQAQTQEETGGSETGGAEAEGGTAGSAAVVDLEADPDGALAYTTDEAQASAGNVTLNFTNPAAIAHDAVLETADGEDLGGTEVVTEGSASAEFELDPGSYTFFCSVPGHREAGMEGTLNVE